MQRPLTHTAPFGITITQLLIADSVFLCQRALRVSKGTSPRQPRRIDLSDIRKLPKRNWYLCNNSFLIHGFFNYHYLIVLECEEKNEKRTYLGVPGIYERPERMMALLFGFPDFKLETEVMDVNSPQRSTKEEPIGKFGYWLCPLEI